MSMLTTRTVSLSVALLLASTSLSHAGFVWLSPDKPNADNTVFSQQAEPAVPAETEGRSWNVEPNVPVASAPAPMLAPAPQAADTTAVVPMTLSEAAPATQVVAPTVTAPAEPVTLVGGDTLSAQPIYAPGDQAPAAQAEAAPVVAPAAPVEMAASAPAPMASAPAVATTTETEVTLATTRGGDMPLPARSAQQGDTAAAAMPSAEAMINGMPSMTAPRETITTTTAVVPPVVTAPVVETPVAAAEAPAQAPVQIAAPAEAPVVPMLSPATVPLQASVTAPVQLAPATSPTPAATASTVSMVTGQPIETTATAAAAAPAMDTQKVIDGFGKHVPLVIAMRQILPSGYGFAHGSGVDLTAAIDWNGGRPWPQVLAEAISPIGLTASVMGETVMIEKLGGSAPVQAAAQVSSIEAPAVTPSSAPLAAGQAVLTNATVMQAPPSNN